MIMFATLQRAGLLLWNVACSQEHTEVNEETQQMQEKKPFCANTKAAVLRGMEENTETLTAYGFSTLVPVGEYLDGTGDIDIGCLQCR